VKSSYSDGQSICWLLMRHMHISRTALTSQSSKLEAQDIERAFHVCRLQ
jgi:hypothetical protein